MLISSNPTSSVKNSSLTDADAVCITRISQRRGRPGCPSLRQNLQIRGPTHRSAPTFLHFESLPPPPDFPTRSCHPGLHPGTRRGLRGASLWRCASSAMTRRNRFFRGATVCPIPLRRVLATPPRSYRLPSPPESRRRRRRAPSLSIHRGRRWRRLL